MLDIISKLLYESYVSFILLVVLNTIYIVNNTKTTTIIKEINFVLLLFILFIFPYSLSYNLTFL